MYSKDDVCKEFKLEASKYTLYRMNHMEEPAFALRREKSAIVKSHVQSGDCLILKADTSITPDEKLTLYIHLTMTGLPEDSQFIEKIDVSKEFSLDDLKDIILSLP